MPIPRRSPVVCDGSVLRGAILAALAAVVAACGPRLARGPVPVEQAADAVPVTALPGDGPPAWELTLLAGGSRWDPPGQAGRMALALRAALPDTIEVLVDRDRAVVRRICPGTPAGCVGELGAWLAGEGLTEARIEAVRARHTEALRCARPVDTPVCVADAWMALTYGAHPYGTPVHGRRGSLAVLRPHDLIEALQSRVVRPTVLGRARGEGVTEALTEALRALPPALGPDPAMKGPPAARGRTLAVLPTASERAWVTLGVAVPRPATRTTDLLPSPDVLAAREALLACLVDEARALGLSPAARVRPITDDPLHHLALGLRVGPLPPAEAERLVRTVPDSLDGLAARCQLGGPDSPLAADALTVVVGWPRGIEDPWDAVVQAAPATLLRIDPEEAFR